jgi:hypothetical protein
MVAISPLENAAKWMINELLGSVGHPWPVRHLYYSVAGLRLFRGANATANHLSVDAVDVGALDARSRSQADDAIIESARARGGPALGGENWTAGTHTLLNNPAR